jgi:hypothetical protein
MSHAYEQSGDLSEVPNALKTKLLIVMKQCNAGNPQMFNTLPVDRAEASQMWSLWRSPIPAVEI